MDYLRVRSKLGIGFKSGLWVKVVMTPFTTPVYGVNCPAILARIIHFDYSAGLTRFLSS